VRTRLLEEGGPVMWAWFMSELTQEHLSITTDLHSKPSGASVAATLKSAYEQALSESR